MKCQRGEIWLVDFNPARGVEQAGYRPAVVVQNDIGNRYAGTTIIAALSTNITPYPQNVVIEPSSQNGLQVTSCMKGGQLLTITQERLTKRLGTLDSSALEKIDKALIAS